MYKVVAPLAIYLPRKRIKDKRIPISLTWYRNAPFWEQAKVKKLYAEIMYSQVILLPTFQLPKITYTWFPKTKSRADLGNATACHQKFFEDILVDLHRVKDDSWKHLVHNVQLFGCIDKTNPRVEIKIEEQF